jgi:adenylate cyclase
LSKVSALEVIARNTAFQFKGQSLDVCEVARKLGVSHVLEGSVRKAGNRVRITAQLVDGSTGGHVWADRYDRDLTDIFAIQDEISKAIAAALELRLLPEEKKAIEQRGTRSADAYNLYLMARQYWITGTLGSRQRDDLIARICRRVVEIDPNYARAWALLALAQSELRFRHWKMDEDALASADRAQSLDVDIAEVHSVRARYLAEEGRYDEATAEVEDALRLGPDSWEVNKDAARFFFRQGRMADALFHFNKAASLMDMDTNSPMMAMSCSRGLGDETGLKQAAETTIGRTEKALLYDQGNAMLWSNGAAALASLGQAERAKEWVERALLIEPENRLVSYNGACTATFLEDRETAIRLIAHYLAGCSGHELRHVDSDPDLAPIRDDPRYKKMFAEAQARVASSQGATGGAVDGTALPPGISCDATLQQPRS